MAAAAGRGWTCSFCEAGHDEEETMYFLCCRLCGSERPVKRLKLATPLEAPITVHENSIMSEICDDRLSSLAPAMIIRNVLSREVADELLALLESECKDWMQGTWTVFNRTSIVERTSKMYSFVEDQSVIDSEETRKAPSLMCEVGKAIEKAVFEVGYPNFCPSLVLANRYANEKQKVGRHSDFLSSLGPRPLIAGLSLGAQRTFRLYPKQRSQYRIDIPTPHNSLILMLPGCQEFWEHEIPPSNLKPHHTSRVRFSLTFRQERPQFAKKLGTCHCGKTPVLKCDKAGQYYLNCNPSGGSVTEKCSFFQRCPWVQEEANRMLAHEQALTKESKPLIHDSKKDKDLNNSRKDKSPFPLFRMKVSSSNAETRRT